LIPARNGDWNRFGSVAVTQFQRRVCRKAAKRRGGSKPFREVCPALVLEDAPVDLVVPEHFQRLALGVVVGAGETDEAGVPGGPWHDDFLDEPAPRADLHQLAGLRTVLRERSIVSCRSAGGHHSPAVVIGCRCGLRSSAFARLGVRPT
jgi:hypothetical protein